MVGGYGTALAERARDYAPFFLNYYLATEEKNNTQLNCTKQRKNKQKNKTKTITKITKNQDVTTTETKLPTEKNHSTKATNYCSQTK